MAVDVGRCKGSRVTRRKNVTSGGNHRNRYRRRVLANEQDEWTGQMTQDGDPKAGGG